MARVAAAIAFGAAAAFFTTRTARADGALHGHKWRGFVAFLVHVLSFECLLIHVSPFEFLSIRLCMRCPHCYP